ncbi:sugar ABC transporter substrate-binding protein [Pseudonocardia sp. TRM90224]|uniref:sugar ABC transporter substrate-binding protein n=1 Tax=Pseudonocardia sp. TRM90224 TaxID=2812678 RepID=UPI001E2FDAA2|nr:sugar ABC transporter substrate-binding protein [Pseudonocardia sp. TRM90224]
MRSTRRVVRGLALAAALGVVLAACSSQGGRQEEAAAPGGGGGQTATTPRLTIAMITHQAPGDTFWDKVRTGAEVAAAKDNVELKYNNDPEAARQATLIQNAVDSGVDGIAVTMSKPEPLAPAIKAAVDKGIPVVAINSGIDAWKPLGIKMYFGSDETVAGESVGERLTKEGAGKALCVIQEQGSVSLEARCAGVKSTHPTTENLVVNGVDLPSVRSTIAAKLQQDPSLTHVVTLGAPFALAALESIADAGSSAKVATFDLNSDAAQAIKDGKIVFSVDQQPYVQGYEAVDALWLNLTNGNDLGGGRAVLTGPSFVDSTNIDQIITYAKNNTR